MLASEPRICSILKLFHPPEGPQGGMTKLTPYKIKRIVNDKEKNRRTNREIATRMKVSERRVQQIYREYRKTGEYPVLNKNRRPRKELSLEEKQAIDDAWEKTQLGATFLRYYLKRHYELDLSHNRIHRYLLETGKAKQDPKKQKKRKRCRYEREHSLSLIHGDWYEPDWNKEIKLIAWLDDASRNILAAGEFPDATSKNTIETFKQAENEAAKWNGKILAVNTDRGSQFYSNTVGKRGRGRSKFELYLKAQGIKHIPSRKKNPQTNGKIERWFQTYERHRKRFGDLREFIDWYNNMMHGELNREWAETPNEAFIRKLHPEVILGLFLKSGGW